MENKKPKVFMVCGISGSGKTFFTKKLELLNIPRLSIDEELWPDFYVLSDILSEEHKDFLYSCAMERLFSKTANFCAEGKSVSVDMPFCKKAQRDAFRAHIESCGGEPVLIHINTELSVLKKRLSERKGKNGPNELPVSEAEVEMYWRGFQRPLPEENAVLFEGTADYSEEELLSLIK